MPGPVDAPPAAPRSTTPPTGIPEPEREVRPGRPLPPVETPPPWRLGLRAARANLVPGAVLSAFAVGLLLAYWNLPAVEAVLQRVGEWKLRGGYGFSAVSTALFGALLPGLVQRLRPRLRHTMTGRHLAFLALFWAYKGVEVDLLYRLQAQWFGHGRGPSTIALKVLIDQGIYVPLIAVPTTALAYAFKDADLSWAATLAPIRRQGVGRWVHTVALPLLLSNWGVWIPAVVVVYCLPLPLQLPMQNLVLCFWSLLLILQVRREDHEPVRS